MASILCFSTVIALASAAEPCLSWCGEWTCSYADCAGCPKSSSGEMRLVPVPKPGERRLLLVAGGAGGRAAAGGWVGAIASVAQVTQVLRR